jgi:predicted amidohydrolase
MIEPYTAVALSPRVSACGNRDDYLRNIRHINGFIDVAHGMAATDGPPVKLIVLPEGAFQSLLVGFKGGNRAAEARMALDLPGPETELLGEKARELKVFIAGNAYMVRDDDFPDRYFNYGFIIDPRGELVYKRAKLQVEPFEPEVVASCMPHDVFDKWVEVKGGGDAMQAFYPVADTEIGRIGMIVCMEGGYPEIGRGLALNGAELLLRQVYHDPYVSNGWWELQNRSFAMNNNAYVVAPNLGPQSFGFDAPTYDIGGGKSMIVDYRGQIMIQREYSASDTFVSECLDLEALRRYRGQNGFGRWFKDMRMEQFAPIYERPIYPKNQYLDEAPTEGWGEREAGVLAQNISLLQDRGVLTPAAGIDPASGRAADDHPANGELQPAGAGADARS